MDDTNFFDNHEVAVHTQALINSMTDILVFKDHKGRWIEANNFAIQLFQLENVHFKGLTDQELANILSQHKNSFINCTFSDEQAWKKGNTIHSKEIMQQPDGNTLIFDVVKIPLFYANGRRKRLIVYGRNMTELERTRQALQEKEQQFESLFAHHPDTICSFDLQGNFININSVGGHMTGYSRKELLHMSFHKLIAPEQLDLATQIAHKTMQGTSQNSNIVMIHKEGRRIQTNITTIPIIVNNHIVGIYGIAKDLSKIKKLEQNIHDVTYYHPITNLPNRKYLEEGLYLAFNNQNKNFKMLSFLCIDLDGFSFINSTLGYYMGDLLLKEVIKGISNCLRENDRLFHIDSNKMVVIMPFEKNIQDTIDVANKILDSFNDPIILAGHEFFVRANMGISSYPNDGTSPEALLQHAEIALRRGKEKGINQFEIYTSTMDIETFNTFMIHNDLYKAVDNKELLVYYQPRVDSATGKLIGAEALVRWNHPEWGILSPNDFIPFAEKSNLIYSIGKWVLQTVCQQNKKWQTTGLGNIPISVNVSGKQLSQKKFTKMVETILEETKLDGKWLELEITESTIVENKEFVNQSLQKLREKGIKFAIDDYGTGFSSLYRLKKLKFNTLKIDQSFIRDLATQENDMMITESVIQLAHGLGMNVVAEGVETEKQLAFLKDKQCDEIQGYLYSKPIPIADFENLLRTGHFEVAKKPTEIPNRRKFFRVDLQYFLSADMTILSINGRKVQIGSTEVLIQNIGPGGLKFLSHIHLPIGSNIILQFSTFIYEPIQLAAHIIWSNEDQKNIYEYGVQFIEDEEKLSTLTQILHQFAIQLRKQPFFPECRFYPESKWEFFKTINNDSSDE